MPNPGPSTTITPSYLLQANSPDGYQIGSVSTTPVGFYGVSGVPQRSNANQLTVSTGGTAGTLLSAQTINIAPAAVGANTTLSQAFTATGSPILGGDFIAVNSALGLTTAGGIGNARAHTATAGAVIMQFFNMGAGAGVTSAAASQFSVLAFRGLSSSLALTPSAVAGNSSSEQTFNVTGVSPDDLVFVARGAEQAGIGLAGVRAAGNNKIAINYLNVSTATITPTAGETYGYVASGGMAANSNVMVYGVNVGVLSVVVSNATNTWVITSQTATCSSILATDILLGVSKPTVQTTIAVVGQRITTANVLNLDFATGAITGVTPTASEVYSCALYRQAPLAPLTVISVTCTPAAIAGATSVEQAFAVTPVAAGSFVWVNPPSITSGTGIVNCRVSTSGVVAIQFANALVSVTATPAAGVYTFGVTPPFPSGGSNYSTQVSNSAINDASQGNELRATLVALGAITGGTP